VKVVCGIVDVVDVVDVDSVSVEFLDDVVKIFWFDVFDFEFVFEEVFARVSGIDFFLEIFLSVKIREIFD
jgi:hypothetical protein